LNFKDKHLKQIERKGLSLQKVEAQIQLIKQGLPFINLESAATIDHGILAVSEADKQKYVDIYDNKRDSISVVKFVPASGAATRMFKFLFQFLENYNPQEESINSYINRNKAGDLSIFFVGLDKFPFYDEVILKLKEMYPDFEERSDNNLRVLLVKLMLETDALNFGFFPKGLLPFHKYKDHVATAFEEHLFEAALYGSSNGKADLHFTISEKHKDIFNDEFKRIEEIVERKTNTRFNISFSYQKESTDTIALTLDNKPYLEGDGCILFRPSGHGALIENLNDLETDIIFVKNIDNVVVFKYEQEVADYKKMLAGLLLDIQKKAFHYLKKLETESLNEDDLIEIAEFLSNKMNVVISSEFEKYSEKFQKQYLFEKLNRPIRVCGMVKNEGEPGGGPFWVKDQSANVSLQIVESAQVDKKNKHQKQILKGSTHFNPVDLVCGVKNYKGEPFDLKKYVDQKAAFITMKTKVGKDIKALELPGLWNGSMANWNTIFVEVPLITFNPVKNVNDLLKAPHQVKES